MELVRELDRDEMDHWWRFHLKCRSCGQDYLFEFFEEIDWKGGNDPQSKALIPLEDMAALPELLKTPPGFPFKAKRFFRAYWPANGEKTVGWIER